MVEIKRWISGTGERIIGKTPEGKVAGAMKPWLVRYLTIILVPVDPPLKAIHIWAAQKELHIARVCLVAPEQINVAGKIARIVIKVRGVCAVVRVS